MENERAGESKGSERFSEDGIIGNDDLRYKISDKRDCKKVSEQKEHVQE